MAALRVQMIKFLRIIFTPAVASAGIVHYWKGNYDKSYRKLAKAYSWGPSIVKNSELQGYLGLALYNLGRVEESKEHLMAAKNYLSKVVSTDKNIKGLQTDLATEIENVLSKIDT